EVKNSRIVASKMPIETESASNCVQNAGFYREFWGWVRKPVNSTASTGFMDRAMGIEPTSEAWEACCKQSKTQKLAAFCRFSKLSQMDSNWSGGGGHGGKILRRGRSVSGF